MFRRKIKRSHWMQGVIDAERLRTGIVIAYGLNGFDEWRTGVDDYESNKIFRLKGETNETKKEILIKIAELQALAVTLPEKVWESDLATDPSKKAYINLHDGGVEFEFPDCEEILRGCAYKSERVAKLDDEYEKLVRQMKTFIMDAWNKFGVIPDWSDRTIDKYCLILEEGLVAGDVCTISYNFIHLPTQVDRREFRSKFTDFEIKLVLTMGVW